MIQNSELFSTSTIFDHWPWTILATRKAIWLRDLLEKIGLLQVDPTTLFVDN